MFSVTHHCALGWHMCKGACTQSADMLSAPAQRLLGGLCSSVLSVCRKKQQTALDMQNMIPAKASQPELEGNSPSTDASHLQSGKQNYKAIQNKSQT